MTRVLQSSLRAGETTTRTAERLLQADIPKVNIPRYVRELSDAARFPRGPGDPNLLDQAVKRWSGQVARLGQGRAGMVGEYTIRSATEQLVHELRSSKPGQIDGIVNRWVLDRARYQARIVARNESVEAFRDAQVEALDQQPWNVGVRWNLSGSHPRPDICDVLANQDLYGLGPGGYPPDRIPSRHTSCLCSLASISDPHYLKREKARVTGAAEPPRPWLSGRRETGEEWLRRQPAEAQRAILGPTRQRLLHQGEKVVTRDHSSLRKVHNMQGRPKPRRDMGPKVDATKLVEADRASMVAQLPELPR